MASKLFLAVCKAAAGKSPCSNPCSCEATGIFLKGALLLLGEEYAGYRFTQSHKAPIKNARLPTRRVRRRVSQPSKRDKLKGQRAPHFESEDFRLYFNHPVQKGLKPTERKNHASKI